MGNTKVWIYKQEDVKQAALPADIMSIVKQHNCMETPVYGRALALFAEQSPYHARCIAVKANCVAGLGWTLTGEAPEVERFIANLEEPLENTLKKLWYDFELFGRLGLELVHIGGKLKAMYHMPVQDLYVTADRQMYWQLMPDAKEQGFTAYGYDHKPGVHEIICLNEYTPRSGYYGLPRYMGALQSMAVNYKIGEFNIKFFDQGGMPDLAIIVEGGAFDKETEKEIQEALRSFKGIDNAHRTLYLPVTQPNVKVRIEKLSDIKDGSFRLLRQDNRDEIVSAHGVPPRLAGIVVSGSMGGSGEAAGQMQIFKETELNPKQATLERFINNLFIREFGQDPGFKLKPMDITTALEDAQRHQIYVSAGIMEANEVRQELGLQPMEDNMEKLLDQLKAIRKQYARGN